MTACGTPFYFSPELINGKPYREPSDVWALGVLLFELLTLQRPFNGDNIASLAIAITNGKHDEEALERSAYAQWLRRLASKEKLLHLDPHKRLALPELLAAVGGLDGDGSEASLLALKVQRPSPLCCLPSRPKAPHAYRASCVCSRACVVGPRCRRPSKRRTLGRAATVCIPRPRRSSRPLTRGTPSATPSAQVPALQGRL